LNEEDLEENDLTLEEADAIVWDPQALESSSGSEEKVERTKTTKKER